MSEFNEFNEFFDLHPRRNIVSVKDVRKIDGIYLEDVPELAPGYSPGYVIVYREWPMDTFIMRKRDGVSHEEIYRMCDLLLKEKNIKPRAHPLDQG